MFLCFHPCSLFCHIVQESVHVFSELCVYLKPTINMIYSTLKCYRKITCLFRVLKWSASRKTLSPFSCCPCAQSRCWGWAHLCCKHTFRVQVFRKIPCRLLREHSLVLSDVYEGARSKLECMWKYVGRSYITVTRYKGWHPQNNPRKGI